MTSFNTPPRRRPKGLGVSNLLAPPVSPSAAKPRPRLAFQPSPYSPPPVNPETRAILEARRLGNAQAGRPSLRPPGLQASSRDAGNPARPSRDGRASAEEADGFLAGLMRDDRYWRPNPRQDEIRDGITHLFRLAYPGSGTRDATGRQVLPDRAAVTLAELQGEAARRLPWLTARPAGSHPAGPDVGDGAAAIPGPGRDGASAVHHTQADPAPARETDPPAGSPMGHNGGPAMEGGGGDRPGEDTAPQQDEGQPATHVDFLNGLATGEIALDDLETLENGNYRFGNDERAIELSPSALSFMVDVLRATPDDTEDLRQRLEAAVWDDGTLTFDQGGVLDGVLDQVDESGSALPPDADDARWAAADLLLGLDETRLSPEDRQARLRAAAEAYLESRTGRLRPDLGAAAVPGGKRARDHGKNEAHGDPDALKKVQPQIDELERRLATAITRQEKVRLKSKIKKIQDAARSRAKGESHSQGRKR